jgi:hypothetical protein
MDDEFGPVGESAFAAIGDEIEQHSFPTEVALLHRTSNPREIVWVHGYPASKVIIFTFPRVQLDPGAEMVGCVREVPVGWRDLASPAAFRAAFERHITGMAVIGWTRKSTDVGA